MGNVHIQSFEDRFYLFFFFYDRGEFKAQGRKLEHFLKHRVCNAYKVERNNNRISRINRIFLIIYPAYPAYPVFSSVT